MRMEDEVELTEEEENWGEEHGVRRRHGKDVATGKERHKLDESSFVFD